MRGGEHSSMRGADRRWAFLAILTMGLSLAGGPGTAFAQSGKAVLVDDEFGEATDGSADASATVTLGDTGVSADAEAAMAPTAGAAPADAAPSGDRAHEHARHLAWKHNSLHGSVGGLHTVDAGSGAVGSFRLQLHSEFFFASDFLLPGDDNQRVGGALSLSATLLEFLEVYASVWTTANSNDKENPELFQALGDTLFGAKLFGSVAPWLTLGGDVEVALLNRVGGVGLSFAGTSLGLRFNATADFRDLPKGGFPLIARLNLQYYLDNTSTLVEDTEDKRYDALSNPAPRADEARNLVSRIERFALGINRTDFFNIALGFEAPLEVSRNFVLAPLLEWTWGIPINRQGYDCLFIPDPANPSKPNGTDDSCLDIAGVSAFPMDLTLGVRVLPPVSGLAFFAAVDVGLTGASTFVRELAPNAPYNVMLGLGYAFDTRRTDSAPAPAAVAPPARGRVRATVVEQGNQGVMVGGAIVHFTGANGGLTALAADAGGQFTTYTFDPGPVTMEISHPDYETGPCAATVPASGDATVVCELVAKPKAGSVAGRLVGQGDAAAAGEVKYTGPSSGSTMADAAGAFEIHDLAPGMYTATVDLPDYLVTTASFEVRPHETSSVEIQLTPRPKKSLVEVRDGDIRIKKQINFATKSAEVNPNSYGLLEEVADALQRNPGIELVEIQGHTDNTGRAELNKELSQQRADAVRTWLIAHGVESGRLTAVGYGMERPLAPNITNANRAKNRRVEFIIVRKAGGTP
ncbi:MAG: OmpA family protein [Polyangiales bacterium]